MKMTNSLDRCQTISVARGCFSAGTLVHTKEGLMPIEKIRVGDLVLSKPENPADGGELAYKRVLKTFVHEDKAIKQIGYMNGPNSKEERTLSLSLQNGSLSEGLK
jgi:hypothetical protein